MAATVNAYVFTGSGPTAASAEGGVTFGRDDAVNATTRIPKPTAAGTNRSWYKTFALYVVSGGGTTSLLNRKIRWATAPAAGLTGYFKAAASYAQAAGANAPADDGSTNDSTPAGWTALSTTFQSYDAATVVAANGQANGQYAQVAVGVSTLYAGGAGGGIALPNLELQYDES